MDRNKLLSVGEGGVLVTNNRDLLEKCLLITDFGARLQNDIKLKKNKKFNIFFIYKADSGLMDLIRSFICL